MRKIVIFGNSGSGKSTLAKKLCSDGDLPHLDLDTLAWKATVPPARMPIIESKAEISAFIKLHAGWIIEGCYSDLLEIVLPCSNELIYMNLPVELCIENARKRAWEPHKYESKEAQDRNFDMLIDWISQYPERTDIFSKASHTALYEGYSGIKEMHTSNALSSLTEH